eukprot:4716668-Lingulodinium_polyedra.AAC.1
MLAQSTLGQGGHSAQLGESWLAPTSPPPVPPAPSACKPTSLAMVDAPGAGWTVAMSRRQRRAVCRAVAG